MGFLARLAARKQFNAQQVQIASSFSPMSADFIKWFGGNTVAGKPATEDSMLTVAAWWCCMRILSESVGMLPRAIYRRTGAGNAELADDHWLNDLLVHSPNRDQDGAEFFETKTFQLVGTGNAYSYIDRLGSRISALTPLEGTKALVKKGSNTKLNVRDGEVFFRVNHGGTPEDLPREKVWQVKLFGKNRIEGLSPLGAAKEAIGGALAMEDFSHRFFSQGAMPAGTVSYPGWLTKEQREVAKGALQSLVGGLGNAHKVALFEGGVKPEPWGAVNLEDLQFILGRRFSILEICRFHRIPPHMLAELEKGAAYASIEQMSLDFVVYTLMPYLTRYEASVSKWLLPAADRGKYFLRFDFEALLRPDIKSLGEFLSNAVNNGIMHRNEARGKLGLNRSTDQNMDAFTAQTALTTIDKLGQDKPAAPAQPGQQPKGDSRLHLLNVVQVPERQLNFKGGDVHVSEREVHLHQTVEPAAAPSVVVAPGAGVADLAAAITKMAENVSVMADGLRISQEKNRDLAERLIKD
jgi:HK97 family phage portal protein